VTSGVSFCITESVSCVPLSIYRSKPLLIQLGERWWLPHRDPGQSSAAKIF